MVRRGGATERGGEEGTAKTGIAFRPRPCPTNTRTSYWEVLGTHRDYPEVGRLPELGRRWWTAAAMWLHRGELHLSQFNHPGSSR